MNNESPVLEVSPRRQRGPSMHTLPRLAVIADVAAEQSGGGALQLRRLLSAYPPERLLVIYNPVLATNDSKRWLPGVAYRQQTYQIPRLIRNRLNPFWPAMAAVLLRRQAGSLLEHVRDFAPEAILTVTHMYLWFAAAEAARTLQVPLHLIVHDDWPTLQTAYQTSRLRRAAIWACRRVMGRVYRQAQSRLCVSPGMEEHCRRWFGVEGDVLYPCRGEDSPAGQVRVRHETGTPPVLAFVGGIQQSGTVDLLREMAAALAPLDGHLDLYTTAKPETLSALGLHAPVVRATIFPPTKEMNERIAQTAHALFLPASFEPREREDMETLFPSKLADYTTLGLPILVWGPEYCSAARWAADNAGAVALVTERSAVAARNALCRLAGEPSYAAEIAAAGIEAGKRYFELESGQAVLYSAWVSPGGANVDITSARKYVT